MKEISCCFTGHRIISLKDRIKIREILSSELDFLYAMGKRRFISGGALGFDQIAAQEVIFKKKKYPDMELIFVLPCKDQDKLWKESQQDEYMAMLSLADKIIYIQESYSKDCMRKRNRFMVENSSACVCFLKKQRGGTYQTVLYAVSEDIPIINIAQRL
ncbi:SLOG family protein [Anaeropeptidivorans aminofermentans]|uniref:SLOG family protein n=1 Tax=Anaeropeptidivorans aminofermentans TaxID=2934315 RepID=UPI0020248866|nr:SLOG family protein [Anaeropeptidivorans aminofermentans]MBE6012434.1 DUF1273 domain-containing protein [Lachnospiraceae bacterium]